MQRVWRKILIWCYLIQLNTITNALHQPKRKMGAYLAGMSIFLIAIPMLFSIAFFIAALFILNSGQDLLLRSLLCGLALITDIFFLFLMFRGYMNHKRLNKNGGLNEVEIWKLQNKTQAKLKALTDA